MQFRTVLAAVATLVSTAFAAPAVISSTGSTNATLVARYGRGEIGMDLCRHQCKRLRAFLSYSASLEEP